MSEANLKGGSGVTVEELEEQAASLEAATIPMGRSTTSLQESVLDVTNHRPSE